MPCSIRSTQRGGQLPGGSAHSDRLASSGQIGGGPGPGAAQHPADPVGNPAGVGAALAVEHDEQRPPPRPAACRCSPAAMNAAHSRSSSVVLPVPVVPIDHLVGPQPRVGDRRDGPRPGDRPRGSPRPPRWRRAGRSAAPSRARRSWPAPCAPGAATAAGRRRPGRRGQIPPVPVSHRADRPRPGQRRRRPGRAGWPPARSPSRPAAEPARASATSPARPGTAPRAACHAAGPARRSRPARPRPWAGTTAPPRYSRPRRPAARQASDAPARRPGTPVRPRRPAPRPAPSGPALPRQR